jgi:hypothetical protein
VREADAEHPNFLISQFLIYKRSAPEFQGKVRDSRHRGKILIPGLIPEAEPAETRVGEDGKVTTPLSFKIAGRSLGFLERKEDCVE